MQFSFSEDQRLLADGVRGFLAGECTAEHVQQAWTDGPSRTRWKALAGLGVVGMLADEQHGGMGMDEVDLALVLEEAGWAGLPEPLAEVTAVAVPLLAAVGGDVAEDLLGAVAAGEVVAVPALAADPFPAHVAGADRVLLQRGDDLLVASPGDLELQERPNVDHARPTVEVSGGVPSGATVVATGVRDELALAAARGTWAAAAQLVGAGRRMIDLATEYAGQREQFGRPIGSFQAVKHHLASALVAVEFARPLVHRAAHSLATGDDRAPLHAAMAKAVAAEAAEQAAQASLQVHGAIGYTWEHQLHLWMKRTWSLAASWGTTEEHWQVVEAATIP